MRLRIKIFTILGFLSLFYSGLLYWERHNPARLSFSSYQPIRLQQPTTHTPITLKVPSLEMELPVIPTEISDGAWTTTKKGVSYLTSSPLPGTRGNSIFYGHNFTNLLGNLHQAQMGDKIQVKYSDGSIQSFIISGMAVVTPDQTHVLQNSHDIRLTIYTCTGFFDSKRLVVTAVSPDSASSVLSLQ